jgi:hypothetical protein
MSANDFGQNVLEQTHVLTGSWEFAGETYALEVEDISGQDFALIQQYTEVAVGAEAVGQDPESVTDDELESLNEKAEQLDDFSWEDPDEDNPFIQSVVGAKLVNPKVDVERTGQSKLSALFRGMMEAWQEADSVKTAKEDMPLDEGNG